MFPRLDGISFELPHALARATCSIVVLRDALSLDYSLGMCRRKKKG